MTASQTREENLLGILIAPRVEEIPKPKCLTLTTTLFILFCACTAVFLIPAIQKEEEGSSLLFPFNEPRPDLSCDLLKLSAQERTRKFQSYDARMTVFHPERFEVSVFFLEDNEVNQMLFMIESGNLLIIDRNEFTQDFLDLLSVLGSFTPLNSTLLSLQLESGLSCDIRLGIRVLEAYCTLKDEGKFITELDFSVQDNGSNLFLSYLFNVHIASAKWNELGGSLSPSRAERPYERSVLDTLTTGATVFCTESVVGDFFTDFGLYSGFGYTFEGLFTFLFAITLFKGRLGLEEKSYTQDNVYQASRKLVVKKFSEASVSNSSGLSLEEEEDYAEDGILSNREIRHILSTGTRHLVKIEDLKRVIHNPRCHFLQSAEQISLLSSVLFFILTAVFAYFFQLFQYEEVCFLVDFEDLQKQADCNPLQFNQRFYLTFLDDDLEEFGGALGMDAFLSVKKVRDSRPLLDTNLMTFLTEICSKEAESASSVSCLSDGESSLEPLFIQCFEEYPRGCNEFFRVDLGNGVSGRITFSHREDNLDLELVLSNTDVFFKASSKPRRIGSANITVDQNLVVKNFVLETIGSEDSSFFRQLVKDKATCCEQAPPFGYFEYFGISLAYMVFLEGFVVLSIAFFVNNAKSKVGNVINLVVLVSICSLAGIVFALAVKFREGSVVRANIADDYYDQYDTLQLMSICQSIGNVSLSRELGQISLTTNGIEYSCAVGGDKIELNADIFSDSLCSEGLMIGRKTSEKSCTPLTTFMEEPWQLRSLAKKSDVDFSLELLLSLEEGCLGENGFDSCLNENIHFLCTNTTMTLLDCNSFGSPCITPSGEKVEDFLNEQSFGKVGECTSLEEKQTFDAAELEFSVFEFFAICKGLNTGHVGKELQGLQTCFGGYSAVCRLNRFAPLSLTFTKCSSVCACGQGKINALNLDEIGLNAGCDSFFCGSTEFSALDVDLQALAKESLKRLEVTGLESIPLLLEGCREADFDDVCINRNFVLTCSGSRPRLKQQQCSNKG